MKMDRFESFMTGILVGWMIGGALIGSLVESMTISHLYKEAIEVGVGEYNGVTGEFVWKKLTEE